MWDDDGRTWNGRTFDGMHDGDWAGMGLMMLLTTVLVVGLVVALVWAIGARRDHHAPATGAEDQLARRFARGEIDAAELERAVEVLRETFPARGGTGRRAT